MSMDSANAAKASFDDIYLQPDPRDYYSVLGSLDYAIPDLAKPIFRQIANAWRQETGRSATILDLGSSYGINAALFRYPLAFSMLRRRYARREMFNLSTEDLLSLDRNYFRSWPQSRPERIIVADISKPAIDYAMRAGIADAGIAGSLEDGELAREHCNLLADVDIVVSTGCVGYVTDKTFLNIAKYARRPPWIVSFVLRMFDYQEIEHALAREGLVTEKLSSAAFVQRRFRDEEEAAAILQILDEQALDPGGLEAEGLLCAELFVSRPSQSVSALPLEELVTVTSGRNISFGPRLLKLNRSAKHDLAPVRA